MENYKRSQPAESDWHRVAASDEVISVNDIPVGVVEDCEIVWFSNMPEGKNMKKEKQTMTGNAASLKIIVF